MSRPYRDYDEEWGDRGRRFFSPELGHYNNYAASSGIFQGNIGGDGLRPPPPSSFRRPHSVPPAGALGAGMMGPAGRRTPGTPGRSPDCSPDRSRCRRNRLARSPSPDSSPDRYPRGGRSRDRDRDRDRDRSRSRDRDRHHEHERERDRDRDRGPVGKAEHALKHTFTSSPSGIGIGVLGAILGGLAARHISDATGPGAPSSSQSHHDHDHDHDHAHDPDDERDHSDRKRHESRLLVSTIVGAAVGGLGANALERRLESKREKREEHNRGRSQREKGHLDDAVALAHRERSNGRGPGRVYEVPLESRRRSEEVLPHRRPARPLDYYAYPD